MLLQAGLPPSLWREDLATLVYVLNCCLTSAAQGMTHYEAFYGRTPDVSHLPIRGCLAYVHMQKDKRGPLGSHMEKCVCSLDTVLTTRAGSSTI